MDFKKLLEPFEPANMKKCVTECSGIKEFQFTAAVALLTAAADNLSMGSFSWAVMYAALYALFHEQFNVKARGNPILSFADWLSGESKPCECVWQIICQCLGWTFGTWLRADILGFGVAAEINPSATVSEILVNEIIASGFLVWLWLSIHHDSSSSVWSDFMGLAVGLAWYVAGAIKSENSIMNPAQFFGGGVKFQAFKQPTTWWISFFAPFFAAFVTTLAFRWSKKD
jgi:glycerol uptake facilitator-like aquaporin